MIKDPLKKEERRLLKMIEGKDLTGDIKSILIQLATNDGFAEEAETLASNVITKLNKPKEEDLGTKFGHEHNPNKQLVELISSFKY